jgi:hypothetical protein
MVQLEKYKEQAVAEADAATARMQQSLRTAKAIVRDYKAKLCRKSGGSARDEDGRGIFRFER